MRYPQPHNPTTAALSSTPKKEKKKKTLGLFLEEALCREEFLQKRKLGEK
jgi:hypothetical protein